MKKVAQFLLLTCVALGASVSSLIPLLHLSVTSKVTLLMLFSFAFSSAALTVLVWGLLGTWSTTQRQDSSNHLAILAKKEKEILERGKRTPSQTFDLWGELHEQDLQNTNNSQEEKHNV